MRQIRRFVSLLLAAAMLLGVCCVNVGAEEIQATVTLGTEAVTNGMSIKVGTTNNYPYTKVEKGGKYGWEIAPARSIQPALYVNLDKSFAYKVKGNVSYVAEVEYFDEGNGQFRIKYDGVPDPWRDRQDKSVNKVGKSEVVKLENTGEWRTHSFILEDPYFADGLEGFDFCVTLHDEAMGISLANVTFGGIRVMRADTNSLVRARMSTEAIGNNFFSDEKVKIAVDMYSSSDKEEKVTVSLKAIDFDGNTEYTDSFEAEIGAKGKLNREVEFTPERYSVYTMYLELKGEGIYSTAKLEYSYTMANETKNRKFGMNNHMYRIMNRNPDKLISLMDKIGVGINREGIWWQYYETKKDQYALPYRADYTDKLLHDADIDQMLILSSATPNFYTIRTDRWPVGEELEQAFVDYAVAQATEFKGHNTYFELMNEVAAHTTDGHDASWYARVARKTYAALKAVDPNITFAIGSTAGTPLDWITTVCKEAEGCYDVFTVHYYGYQSEPRRAGHYEALVNVRNIMDENGAKDIPLSVSETGYSTGWIDYRHQAAYNTQLYAELMMPDLNMREVIFYDFHDDGYMPEDQENNFGAIRTWDTVDTPYIAKPWFVASGAVNRFLTDAEVVDRIRTDTASYFKFKRADGKDVVMVWSQRDSETVTMSLGTDDAEVYDMYGNKLDIYRRNGIYSTTVDMQPLYFVGNFTKYEIGAEPVFELSGTEFNMPYDDIVDITITKKIDANAKVEVVLPDDGKVEVYENKGFVGDKAVVRLRAEGQSGKSSVAQIAVTGDNGELYMKEKIALTYTDVTDVSFKTEPYGGGNLSRWVGVFKVKNNNHVEPIKGKIVFNAPSDLADKIGYVDIPEIKPDTEVTIRFNMPELLYCRSYFIDADVKLDNGYVQKLNLYADCCAATYAEKKPVIDAVRSDGEWDGGKVLRMGEGNEFELKKSYKGNADLSAEVIYKWDEENLYMYAEVTDDIMYQKEVGNAIWGGDSVQIGIHGGVENNSQTLFTELGFAITPIGPTTQKYSTEPGATMVADKTGEAEMTELAVERRGTTTYYEARIPWTELLNENILPLKAGDSVRFNMIVNDNDGDGRWGWIEYGAGIGEYKDGSLFGYLNLIDNRKNK